MTWLLPMDFHERLTALRKERGLTQQALADLCGVHVMQVRRYESGQTQPTLGVLRKLAVGLRVTADELVFGSKSRGPDEELRLQFEAISHFPADEKKVIKAVLDGLILKHEAKRWSAQ